MTARAMGLRTPSGSLVSKASSQTSSSGTGRLCSSTKVTVRPRERSHSAVALGLAMLPLSRSNWVSLGARARTVS